MSNNKNYTHTEKLLARLDACLKKGLCGDRKEEARTLINSYLENHYWTGKQHEAAASIAANDRK